jgi:hypothetical protein
LYASAGGQGDKIRRMVYKTSLPPGITKIAVVDHSERNRYGQPEVDHRKLRIESGLDESRT